MNVKKIATAPARGVKRLGSMIFRRYPWRMWRFGGQYMDYGQVGDGTGSSTVMIVVQWIARTFPEAPPALWKIGADGQEEQDPKHDLLQLLKWPNPYYTGSTLWQATLVDWIVSGESYWLKVRDRGGRVTELWWVPALTIEPQGTEDDFITQYVYKPGDGQQVVLDPTDLVHFRYGLDPDDPKHGWSPLKAVLREVYTDDEAAVFSASLLRNSGVPGLLVSPEGDIAPSADDVDATKAYVQEAFTGSRRGEPLVFSGPTKVQQFGFNPDQLALKDLRRIPEERVSAVLGVPAIACGLGAGLDRSCMPADARVMTPHGPRPIIELAAGDVVWSFKDGEIVPRPIEHVWRTSSPDLVYEVKTSRGEIRATGNHPLMVRVAGDSVGANRDRHATYEWRNVEDIKPGDCLVQAMSYPDLGGTQLPDGRRATIEMLQFLGAVIGDGTVSPGVGVRIAMPPADRCVETYRGLALSLFSKQASRGMGAEQVENGRAAVVIQSRERDFGFSSAQDSRLLDHWGFGGRAHTKRIPGWVFSLRRDLRLALLAGIVDTDGTVDKRGAMSIAFCSEALTRDVRDLATSCGLACTRIYHGVVDARSLPNPGIHDSYEHWRFTISSAVDVASIPFSDPLYRERVDANQHRHRPRGKDATQAGLSDDLGFFMVKSVTALQEEWVYDLTVGDGHSFFSEHVLASNTFANFAEAREAAYESNIIPAQRLLAEQMQLQLLVDFEPNMRDWRLGFDLSGVRVLQEDMNALATRFNVAITGGWAKVAEGRRALDLDVDDTHEIFLRPSSVYETTGEELQPTPAERSQQALDAAAARPAPVPPDQQQSPPPPGPPKAKFTGTKLAGDQTPRMLPVIHSLENDIPRLAALLEDELSADFAELGTLAADAYLTLIGPDGKLNGNGNGHSEKLLGLDTLAARVAYALGLDSWRERKLTARLTQHYKRTARRTAKTIGDTLGIPVHLMDHDLEEIGIQGANRRLLMDIRGQTRKALLNALEVATEEGKTGDEVAALIRKTVPAGGFNGGAAQRAQGIAYNETLVAQRLGTLLAYKASGQVSHVVAFDGTEFDEDCAARNGRTFTLSDAQDEGEHPNGVLAWGPITGDRAAV